MSVAKAPDFEKALLLLYALQIGMPPWANGDAAEVLARLMDWPIERAVAAMQTAVNHGFATARAPQEPAE